MGWWLLYAAFGIVALWLLGEVLLQYKARLRWRMLAFVGFVGVVIGVLMPNVMVIGFGAILFAVGQTYVTLSFRRGFSTGWALGGNPGESRRRKGGEPAEQDPTLQVSDLEYDAEYGREYDSGRDPGHPADFAEPEPGRSPVYAPEPMPDDTGQYGVYGAGAVPPQPAAAPAGDYGYDSYANPGYDQQSYGYEPAPQQYAAYSDPYIGTQGAQPYDTGQYATYGGQQQGYDQGYQDPYAAQYPPGETPAGGVWVPQQRSGDDLLGGELPPEQPPYPYQNGGYDAGYNEQQYRY
ncbi:hypothetical protein P8605_28410 [Streptomyces sp. T-3]|nr:hypothetical protein [Streptomyces sp. T-3]